MQAIDMLTIGQLAKQVGVRTSTLRYYEREGLLQPAGRSPSDYRLYAPEAAHTVRLIQRTQRLGFSLADIRPLLHAWETGDLNDDVVINTAENRYLSLERQITRLLVQQHELELFVQDLHQRRDHTPDEALSAFDQLLARVCADPITQASSRHMFDWLIEQSACGLTSVAGQSILQRLSGQHTHIWQDDDAYNILIVSDEPDVGAALKALAQLESACEAHAHTQPKFSTDEEGFLFVAKGENAFIYARLFLALEKEATDVSRKT